MRWATWPAPTPSPPSRWACWSASMTPASAMWTSSSAGSSRVVGEDDDTVVVVTADHRNSLAEHGILDHFFSVHQPLAAVPLIIRHPDLPQGVVERPVGTIDLAPTILETAGLDSGGLDGLDGIPL